MRILLSILVLLAVAFGVAMMAITMALVRPSSSSRRQPAARTATSTSAPGH